MAPSLKKALKAFIEGIPANKLENFPAAPGTLFTDDDFRLDLQGVSKQGPDLETPSYLFIHSLKLLHSLPGPHTTCRYRRIKARRIRPFEKPRQKVWLGH